MPPKTMLLRGCRYAAFGCLLLVPLLPLVVVPALPFPFVAGKAYAFRLLALGATVSWLLLRLGDASLFTRVRRPWPVAIGLLLLALLVSDLRADYPRLALLGDYSRMEGFVLLAHLGLFAIVAHDLLSTRKLQYCFLLVFCLGSLGVAVPALFQVSQLVVADYWRLPIFSTFGNSSYFGQYTALIVMLCWALFHATKGRFRYLLLTIGGINMVLLPFSQSRGALLALLAGGGTFFLLRRPYQTLLASVALALIGLETVWLAPHWGENAFLLRRFSELQGLQDPRWGAWLAALQAIQIRPWLGWGQESFRGVHLLYCTVECGVFDRAHNWFLDRLTSTGIAGLSAWGLVLWIGVRHLQERTQGAEKAAMFAFMAAYFVSSMPLFDTLSSYLLFFSVLSLRKPVS